jgi:hypothetical protein
MEEFRGNVRRLYFAAFLSLVVSLNQVLALLRKRTYVEERSGERPASPE